MSLQATIQDVVAHFEGKTQAILRRYGPGPRVHYHAGLVDDPPTANASPQTLRSELVQAQERLLEHAATTWDAPENLSGEILDVGCGLGGGAIFWAQEFRAKVTAVTCVASHVPLVAGFAACAGVQSRVAPMLCDALDVEGQNCFDAAVAIDSSCYLARDRWFQRLAVLLRPGGRVLITDCFLGHASSLMHFDRYWQTRIGSFDEYLNAATQAGLKADLFEDISDRTKHFWTRTLALIDSDSQEGPSTAAEAKQREASVRAHSLVRQGLTDKRLRYLVISFVKPFSAR